MDPEMRLKLSDLKENSWLQGEVSMSTTPLCTPDVLESSGPTVRTYVNATYKVIILFTKILRAVGIGINWVDLMCFHFFCHAFSPGFQPW